jgi:hypothetical protein
MALFDDTLTGREWVTGLAIGIGAMVVLPLAVPILRPLAKTAIKGGILAYRGAGGRTDRGGPQTKYDPLRRSWAAHVVRVVAAGSGMAVNGRRQ